MFTRSVASCCKFFESHRVPAASLASDAISSRLGGMAEQFLPKETKTADADEGDDRQSLAVVSPLAANSRSQVASIWPGGELGGSHTSCDLPASLLATPCARQALRSNFYRFAICFGVNHACVTIAVTYATSTLQRDVAYVGNAVLYVLTALSALLLGKPAVARLGSRCALLLALAAFAVYCALFAFAAFLHEAYGDTQLEAVVFIGGSGLGGVAAGMIWTGQGAYFSCCVDARVALENLCREEATATMAATFASILLLAELAKLALLALLVDVGIRVWQFAGVYSFVAVLSWAAFLGVFRLEQEHEERDAFEALKGTFLLWADPCVWLLAGANFTFGFSSSLLGGYIGGTFTSVELGHGNLALMSGITALTAAVFAKLFGFFRKGCVMSFGSLCFFGIPCCLFFLGCCRRWGWWLVTLYLLQGPGRAMYESTNRAVFADFFPGRLSEAAFANCTLQSSLAAALCFFGSDALSGPLMGGCVFGLAIFTPVGYLAAKTLRRCCPLEAALRTSTFHVDSALEEVMTPRSVDRGSLDLVRQRSVQRTLSESAWSAHY
eukprot:TRINITY_DN14066_c0_g1_i1.p1 TRINITY_DN14066_c0_g1~~TRINITY_DN14066_c0_g1_i1.p1  ORF type:complete len:554 (+),score=99.94 TRINITY_DN14066_c0_g1_i1:2-1663(+)